MKVMAAITLTDEEKRKLAKLSQSAAEVFARRARLILAYGEGKPTMQASQDADISRGRARFWKRQFLARRMSIFQTGTITTIKGKALAGGMISAGEEKEVVPSQDYAQTAEKQVIAPIPYPQPRKKIGMTADDTLAEAGKKVWLFYFAEMLDHEQGTLQGDDIEELHDMRVATRRMRSAFDIFSPAFPTKIMEHQLKGLRKIGRVLGTVRDLDVLLEKAVSYQDKLDENEKPGLQPLLDDWSKTIEQKRLKMAKHLHSEAYQNFKYNFNLFLQVPETSDSQPVLDDGTYSRVRDVVPVLVYSRYAAVRAYEAILPTASVNQLHALRIEFKKFRYTLEYFREILGEGIQKAIGELKHLQDHLGELHDADVACQLVIDFMQEWDNNQLQRPITERQNPEPIATYLAYLHAERYRLTSTFPELWRKFNRAEFRQIIAQAVSTL
jgi:CHAD domain-containing protein